MINPKEVHVLAMLIRSLQDAAEMLEEAYVRKDIDGFEGAKKLIIAIKLKIDALIESEH